MRFSLASGGSLCLSLILLSPIRAEKSLDDLVKECQVAAKMGKLELAIQLADQAVAKDGKSTRALMLRAMLHETLEHHKEAIADYTKVIELDPKEADAFNQRGGVRFKLGRIKESIDDFDRFLELKPEEMAGHWQRGISYYYAGRFEDGRKQFEAGKKVFADDVENAVWCYLCTAKADGADKARASLLKITEDKRIPMMVVYDLFQGKAKPEDVLKAAEEGKPTEKELKQRLFYAHLYLGLWYDAAGDRKKAQEHMAKAAEEFKLKGYMCDVARVHLEMLRNSK
jgi:lipoprotein NlpI